MIRYVRKLYDWTLRIAAHRHATWGLAGISFAESSVFPIPPDVVMIPMALANRARAFFYAGVCSLFSTLGGLVGYAIGFFLYETIGQSIIDFYGMAEAFEKFQGQYNEWGGWIVFGAGLTPIPYKVITIASGVTQMNIPIFIVTSFFGRAMRFYLVAALIWKFGKPIQDFIEKYMGWLTIAFFVLLIGGFVLVKYLVQ
ncbi:MAG: DedA family protein [Alphaproteobacteria bacterium]|nr:DedA family protein [Alphaproteobacteria bacterium]